MPIYEYFCPKCRMVFEVMRPFSESDALAHCSACGTSGEKLVSAFASKADFSIKTPAKEPFRDLTVYMGSPSKLQRESREKKPEGSRKKPTRSPRVK